MIKQHKIVTQYYDARLQCYVVVLKSGAVKRLYNSVPTKSELKSLGSVMGTIYLKHNTKKSTLDLVNKTK